MSNDLVAYSRAGDVFHYRWAARRCLRMIYPNSDLTTVVIEGSNEDDKAGEYVIDVAEYYVATDDAKKIHYYQLKHTTVQGDDPFTLSHLKGTFEGFAKRFSQHRDGSGGFKDVTELSFTVVTNRKIADAFKQNIAALSLNEEVDRVFAKTIKSYTKLAPDELAVFASLVYLEDGEGNYNVQKEELRTEIAQLTAGSVDNAQIDTLEALVKDKVLPDSDGQIVKEEVLRRFPGITSEHDLYPAPPNWDENTHIVERNCYTTLKDKVYNSSTPVIIHAAGGVGKSVFCRQFINSLPDDSFGVAFDCFGAGNYRKRSETRHLHRKALIQIANELASRGLCDVFIAVNGSSDENIMRGFIHRLEAALTSLKKVNYHAQLFILIDAADNAEMAAKEFNQPCFASELLRETMPKDCKLIMLCRTERVDLLHPEDSILQLELESFSEEESKSNLLKHFPDASIQEGKEFHRLTSGNPRVQANTFALATESLVDVLAGLGPSGTTVEDQINLQLTSAVGKIKSLLTPQFENQINAICTGLANLPPHIPLEVLAKTSNVSVEHIKSFIADMGRPLWLTDLAVQFRDEPTETWFRKNFRGSKDNFESYINVLEPLAKESTYIAQVLPQLYLQAQQYEKLIEIALSDQFLPEDNPVDARNTRIYRLQFAFKAALRSNNYEHAVKLAMRAGEEVAGDNRQLHLFRGNIDLLIKLQDPQKVQELAFKRTLKSSWLGSENVFTASLLSGIDSYKGEATGFLRSSLNWMHLFFKERDKSRELQEQFRDDNIDFETDDLLELAYAHLNIYGSEQCIKFLQTFWPKDWVFFAVKRLARRLIDFGEYATVVELLSFCERDPYFVVALTSALIDLGKVPEVDLIETCLDLLCHSKYRIEKPRDRHSEGITQNIISFLEACLYRKLPSHKILRVLRHYVSERASRAVYDTHFNREQNPFMRSLAIRTILSGSQEIDKLIPQHLLSETKGHEHDREIENFKAVVNGLLPWFLLRIKTIVGDQDVAKELELTETASKKARENRYRNHDTLPREICGTCVSILIFNSTASVQEIKDFYDRYLQSNTAFYLSERLDLLRSAFRLKHLDNLKESLEVSTYEVIKSMQYENGPEEISNRYIDISRAVMISSPADASVYFEEAIKVVSKFGDEITERWKSIVTLADRITLPQPDQLAYKFIKCAEVVGDTVDREKYWDRGKAIMVCARMSPGVGISALSRWRDRDIGRFEWLLYAILQGLVETKMISSSIGWALSAFHSLEQRQDDNYIKYLLENESDNSVKQFILDDMVHLLNIEGSGKGTWLNLYETAKIYNLDNPYLNDITIIPREKSSAIFSHESSSSNKTSPQSEEQWTSVFESIDLTTLTGIEESIKRFETLTKKNISYRDRAWYWTEVFKRIEQQNIWRFIDVVILSNSIDPYDFQEFIKTIKKEWGNKVSFQKAWPSIIERIGQKFAYDFTESYSLKYFIEGSTFDENDIEILKRGIFKGLSETIEFADAKHFFGFIELASTLIPEENIPDILNYSLNRFELHIEADFGDGAWDEWLKPKEHIIDNIGGFIWSALGSPRAYVRWNAVHCVKKLAQLNSVNVIDSLVKWMEYDKVDAFGSSKYPFYNLHARQYLLIACARISIEYPELLKPHLELFTRYALLAPHALIQKFAAETLLNIEGNLPGSIKFDILEQVQKVGKSPFPISEVEYGFSTKSIWHQRGEVEVGLDFHFSWDFDRYWFEPLGGVFGIPESDVQDLAANIVINEWGTTKSGYNSDPRVGLWNNSSNDRETWHEHSSYPKTDNLDFYLSYHSMHIVAGMLIEKMPVVKKYREWYENEWDQWLLSHSLTTTNGEWLSDFRDPVPMSRPNWVFQNETEKDWEINISDHDFLNCLKNNGTDELWLNVNGGWAEKANSKYENYRISTALVSRQTSFSLMNALQTCTDPYDYKLPNYEEEEEEEINSTPFKLRGWLYDKSISKGLDEFDPYAEEIEYPPYFIGKSIIDQLGLFTEKWGKYWYSSKSEEKPVLVCESWISSKSYGEEDPAQSGKRLKATLALLKQLCMTQKCHIVFVIQIKREITYRSRDIGEYRKPLHKIYILTENGELRTTETSYQLR